MALTPEQLAKILNKSKDLCSAQGDRLVEQKASGKAPNNNFFDVDPNSYSDEWDNFSLSETTTPASTYKAPTYNDSAFENSHMPNTILESIKQNPIDVNGSPSLDAAFSMVQQKPKQSITETTRQNTTVSTQQYNTNAQIDYSIIKAIVKECISEYFSNKPLNENTTLRQIGLSEGKIKLVDNKGDIFSAKLEYDGNLKDRKKK